MNNKEIAVAFSQGVINDKNFSLMSQYLDKDVVTHSPLGDYIGQRPLQESYSDWLVGFPDTKMTILQAVCEGEFVMIYSKAQATHKGIFTGIPPSNKKIAFSTILFFHVQEKKITEFAAFFDMAQLTNQLK